MTQFETLDQYLDMARKIIIKFAPKFYSSLAQEMLKDEDAISQVASAIMEGDWKWNPAYRSKKNTVCSKNSYRIRRGIWGIQSYISKKKKQKYNYSLSYIYSDSDSDTDLSMSGVLEDKKSINPSVLVSKKEEDEETSLLIHKCLNSGLITKKQKEYITAYYLEDKTLQEIGNEFGVTREAVRQGIHSGIDNLRKYI